VLSPCHRIVQAATAAPPQRGEDDSSPLLLSKCESTILQPPLPSLNLHAPSRPWLLQRAYSALFCGARTWRSAMPYPAARRSGGCQGAMRGSARCAARDRVRKGETLPSRTAVSQTRHDRTPDRRCVHGRPHLSGDHVRRTRPALPAMPPHHHNATPISIRAPRGLPQWQLAVRMAGVTNTDSASTSPGSGSFDEPTTLRPRSSGFRGFLAYSSTFPRTRPWKGARPSLPQGRQKDASAPDLCIPRRRGINGACFHGNGSILAAVAALYSPLTPCSGTSPLALRGGMWKYARRTARSSASREALAWCALAKSCNPCTAAAEMFSYRSCNGGHSVHGQGSSGRVPGAGALRNLRLRVVAPGVEEKQPHARPRARAADGERVVEAGRAALHAAGQREHAQEVCARPRRRVVVVVPRDECPGGAADRSCKRRAELSWRLCARGQEARRGMRVARVGPTTRRKASRKASLPGHAPRPSRISPVKTIKCGLACAHSRLVPMR
jgi:hypothetical protein